MSRPTVGCIKRNNTTSHIQHRKWLLSSLYWECLDHVGVTWDFLCNISCSSQNVTKTSTYSFNTLPMHCYTQHSSELVMSLQLFVLHLHLGFISIDLYIFFIFIRCQFSSTVQYIYIRFLCVNFCNKPYYYIYDDFFISSARVGFFTVKKLFEKHIIQLKTSAVLRVFDLN